MFELIKKFVRYAVPTYWDCPRCGCLNPYSNTACSKCGKLRP